jgi:hypothetical protein
MAKNQDKIKEILKVLERLDVQVYGLKAKIKDLEGMILEQNRVFLLQKRQIFQENVAINELFKQLIKHQQEAKP